ncbi:hypothetical protein H0X06_05820 [Candidatus Dependentiae bacterium]|nr:hypothetical protein [Candidatus Dependentiae bacterium]
MSRNSRIVIILIATLLLSAGCKNSLPKQAPTTLVFMIGTPSSGKTSIAKALQKQLTLPYLYAPTDTFVAMLPSSYLPALPREGERHNKQGIYFVKETGGSKPCTSVKLGPLAQKLTTGIIAAIAGMGNAGLNVLVEGVIWEKTILEEAARGWKDFRVFFIHINPSLEEAERRESQRKDWFTGGGRVEGQVCGAHKAVQAFGAIYDLELDTTHMTPEQGAASIIAYMEANPTPTAFRKLAS